MSEKKNQKTIKFLRELVVDEWDFPSPYLKNFIDDNGNSVEWIKSEIVDQRRWVTTWEALVNINGKFYNAYYDVGSTEMQECSPWECEEFVTFYEVEPKEVTVTQYFPVYEE